MQEAVQGERVTGQSEPYTITHTLRVCTNSLQHTSSILKILAEDDLISTYPQL